MSSEHHDCGCHGRAHQSVHQTLDEMEFERGLWSAALDGDLDRVEKLLRDGRDPNMADSSGYTPLHYASRNGHDSVVRALLGAGACASIATRSGAVTPLHRAAYCGHTTVVRLLLSHRAHVDAVDTDAKTALHKACEKGHVDVVQILLQYDKKGTLKSMKDNRDKVAKDYVPETMKELHVLMEQ